VDCVVCVEVGGCECLVELAFVFFCYVEYEWSEACVVVVFVLFPDGGASDGCDYACAGFADFHV